MVSGPDHLGNAKDAEISLCIYPHLQEFVVVDARPGLPGRPRFDVLRVEQVFDESFFTGLEGEFSGLLRREEMPFLKLLSLPQDVEGLVRVLAVRAILGRLNLDVGEHEENQAPSIAVLFMTGPFLTLGRDGLHQALEEMFEGQLEGESLRRCIDLVTRLANQEREAGEGTGTELTRLIQGDSSHYATLWQDGE